MHSTQGVQIKHRNRKVINSNSDKGRQIIHDSSELELISNLISRTELEKELELQI